MKDLYAVLELPHAASQAKVREQYRLLVQAWHPDKFTNPAQKAQAEERMKEINSAYQTLGDPFRRSIYDRQHRADWEKQAAEDRRQREALERFQRDQAEAERRRREQVELARQKAQAESQHRAAHKVTSAELARVEEKHRRRTEFERHQQRLLEEDRRVAWAYAEMRQAMRDFTHAQNRPMTPEDFKLQKLARGYLLCFTVMWTALIFYQTHNIASFVDYLILFVLTSVLALPPLMVLAALGVFR